VKTHVGIYRNETADRLAKETTQNHYVTYSRIPKSDIKKGDPGRKYKKMAESMGGNNKRRYY
jgi:ribonuclease HI